ncbi:ATP-binding SpoIIE family protein phosphatase [Streptomyces sp. NPDC001985]|uniref:ATP-binding SpoIIE family protein phosphatase n=1 Tax=Streptomyces sp. NPDC001985 TaxID=3154406 RepID=UPI00332E2E01
MGTVSAPTVLECEDIAWFRDDPALPAAARGAAAALARRIGLSAHRASEVALAVTEAATNLQRHAVDGGLLLRVLRTDTSAAVEFITVDAGPGMADVSTALSDGVSSAGTLGIGLGAVARLADVFDLHSTPGRGTVMVAQFWPRAGRDVLTPVRPDPVAAGLTRPISGETACGDAWAVRIDDGARDPDTGPALLAILCDGLGHGPLAARSSEAAIGTFRRTTARDPEMIMREVHGALRGTRGGAVAVARVEPGRKRVLLCGVGNVSAFVVGSGARRSLLSAPGIVGHQIRTFRTFEQPLDPGGALVLHTDGLTERWSMDAMPGLLHRGPTVIAAQLLREAAVRRDDAGIVVVKGAW